MKFILKKDKLQITNFKTYNSGSINYYEADVEYDDTWQNLSIEAILIKGNEQKGKSIAVINNKIYIDQKYKGRYLIGFIGYTIQNETKIYQISSELKSIYFTQGAGEIEVLNSEEVPTPSEWEIYLAQVQEFMNNANTIINQANNLDISASKENKTTTITITKKDGTTQNVNINDGIDGKDGVNRKRWTRWIKYNCIF